MQRRDFSDGAMMSGDSGDSMTDGVGHVMNRCNGQNLLSNIVTKTTLSHFIKGPP